MFPLCPVSEDPARRAVGDGRREKEDNEFSTVNANERVPLDNSLSLSALTAERRSGKPAYLQYVCATATYVNLPYPSDTKVKTAVIVCSEEAGLLVWKIRDLL